MHLASPMASQVVIVWFCKLSGRRSLLVCLSMLIYSPPLLAVLVFQWQMHYLCAYPCDPNSWLQVCQAGLVFHPITNVVTYYTHTM